MSESTANPGVPRDQAALLAVLDQFVASDRYSHQRDELLEQLAGATYACEIEFSSSERTYGYTPDERFRDGRTVIGQLSGSKHKVSMQMLADQNDQVESFQPGDKLSQVGRFTAWSSIYDRFELQAVFSAVVPADQAGPVEPEPTTVDPPQPAEPTVTESMPEDSTEPLPSVGDPLEKVRETVEEPALQPAQTATTVKSAANQSVVPISPVPVENRNRLLDAEGPLSSAELIQFLVDALQLQKTEVTAIVDGFWDYVLQPEHYGSDSPKQVLPNFGTFSLGYEGHRPILVFQSRTTEQLRGQQASRWNQVASERWVRYFQGQSNSSDVSRLSVKRRMSVWIAQQTGQPLSMVHRVIWELMNLVSDLMADGRRKIRWAMRGEMYPLEGVQKGEDQARIRYAFRTYERLAKKLYERAPKTRARSIREVITELPGLKSLLNPANFFKGPGVLRGRLKPGTTETMGASTPQESTLSPWFSMKWWCIPWLFVIFLNFADWPYLAHSNTSLQALIRQTTIIIPFVLSVIFFLVGACFLNLTGQPRKLLPQRTCRFFVVMSVLIGMLGFGLALLQWFVDLVGQ